MGDYIKQEFTPAINYVHYDFICGTAHRIGFLQNQELKKFIN